MSRPLLWRKPASERLRRLPASFSAPFAAWAQEANITGPQPELPKEKLVIITRDGARHEFNVEMALTLQQQTVGLM